MMARHAAHDLPRRLRPLLVAAVLALAGQVPGALAEDAGLKIYSRKAGYEDVKFELQNAIVNRGLTVDFNGQVSRMLDRTGADVGSTKPIYKQAEYFTFCSAKLSRAMMEADPANAGYCPYVVFMYETAASPGTTHVGYRRLQAHGSAASKAATGEIDKLLDAIAREAVK